MESFKAPKLNKSEVENKEATLEVDVDALLEEFPEELQSRLDEEISDLNDADAVDYLVTKLTARKEAIKTVFSDIEGVVVLKETPHALAEMIGSSRESGNLLGAGINAEVTDSPSSPNVCFKVLFADRAEALRVNIFKEAGFQHQVQQLLSERSDCAQVPEILSVVHDGNVQAIMMKQVDGVSLKRLIEVPGSLLLPDDFDIDEFFEKLQRSLDLMHEYGYFHRDLTNNAGNVLIDKAGEPWIIDFGACVKSIDPERSTNSYQLTLGGARFLQKDDYGISLLKERLLSFVNKQGVNHG